MHCLCASDHIHGMREIGPRPPKIVFEKVKTAQKAHIINCTEYCAGLIPP